MQEGGEQKNKYFSRPHPQAGMHGAPMHPAAGAYSKYVRVVLVRSMAAISHPLSGPMLF